MKDYEKYGIAVGQLYASADGHGQGKPILKVVDVETYAECGDIIVLNLRFNDQWRIDCFKLAMVRYYLVK